MTTSRNNESMENNKPMDQSGRSIPIKGMVFASIEVAEKFYGDYARGRGFSIKRSDSYKTKCGSVFACTCEGYAEGRVKENGSSVVKRSTSSLSCGCKAMMRIGLHQDRSTWYIMEFKDMHNHEMVTPSKRRYLSINRHMSDEAREVANAFKRERIPMCKVTSLFGGNGPSGGIDERDVYNHKRTQRKKANKTKIGGPDVDPSSDGILGSDVIRIAHLHRRMAELAYLAGSSESAYKAVMKLISAAFVKVWEILDKESAEAEKLNPTHEADEDDGSQAEQSEFTDCQGPTTQAASIQAPATQTPTSQVPAIDDLTVSRTKGRKKVAHIPLGIELSQRQRQKKQRTCTECKGTNHDKRTCPQLKAQQQQSSIATQCSSTSSVNNMDLAIVDGAVDFA